MHKENIPIHQLDTQMILSIERIEQCDPINFDGTHRHSFYEILFFTKAGTNDSHFIDFVQYPIKPQTLHILSPGQVYKINYNDLHGFMIAIHPDYFISNDNLFEPTAFPTIVSLDKDDLEQIQLLNQLILYEYEHKQREVLLRSYLDSLIQILRISNQSSADSRSGDKRVQIYLRLVEDSYKTNREVTFYAQKMAVGEKTLNRFCLKYLGVSPKQIILNRLLLEARRKIATTELSFQEIALDLGFKEPSYFTRFFRQQSGQTPEQFKSAINLHISPI